jgi:2-polyprenyl-6-methoxyphenol hydroxylase-like FAD-dependent oxidoreductase
MPRPRGRWICISPPPNERLRKAGHLAIPCHLFLATCARGPRSFNILTEQMAEVLSMPVIASQEIEKNEQSVSMMTLRQVLLTGLEDVVSFDKRFSHYAHNEDGSVTAFFEDGSHSAADVLVGADGVGSKLRKQRLPDARLEETGILSVAGKVALTPASRALITDKMNEGVTLLMAPRGYGAIVRVMEFKWQRHALNQGVGGNDAALIANWPGLLYDNTADYIMWAVWAARRNLPVDPTALIGGDLVDFANRVTRNWHPNMRKLIELTDPTTTFAINVRTSVPVSPWASSNVTLLGDAIHTMTPGRGVGANTALRDAALLCKKLTGVRGGTIALVQAIHEYEVEMLRYSTDAVLESRNQMDARDAIHRPILGRIVLASMRTMMRLTNMLPGLKRRMAHRQMHLRSANQGQ